MLINFSNHPSAFWSAEQTEAAEKQFGKIVDLPFPAVNPAGDEDYIQALAEEFLQKVRGIAGLARNDGSVVIHIMGEQTFTTAMVRLLQTYGFTCVASTTERVAKEENGVKTSEFRFVMFREYT
jgi:chitinase